MLERTASLQPHSTEGGIKALRGRVTCPTSLLQTEDRAQTKPQHICPPPRSGPYHCLAFSPPAQRPTHHPYQGTEHRSAASPPPRVPSAQVTAGPADTLDGWLQPGVSPPGEARRYRPREMPAPQEGPGPLMTSWLVTPPTLPGKWHSRGGPAESSSRLEAERNPDIRPSPPGSPSLHPGGHPMTRDQKRGGTKRRGPATACPGESRMNGLWQNARCEE